MGPEDPAGLPNFSRRSLARWAVASAGLAAAGASTLLADNRIDTSQLLATSVRTFGAKGDGASDDTSALQAALDASTNVYFPPGVYTCRGLTLREEQLITGAGFSSQLRLTADESGPLLRLQSVSRVVVRGLHLRGPDEQQSNPHRLIDVRAAGDCLIDHCILQHSQDWAINISEDSVRVTIQGCHITENAKGVRVQRSRDCDVSSNNVSHSTDPSGNWHAAIRYEECLGGKIFANHCEDNARVGISLRASERIAIHANQVTRSGLDLPDDPETWCRGIEIAQSSHYAQIIGNTCTSNQETGIFVSDSGGPCVGVIVAENTVLGNNVANTVGGHGIEFNGLHGRVTGNHADGNNCGISVNGNHVLVQGNVCTANDGSFGVGIKAYGTEGLLILGNTCLDNKNAGIAINADTGVPVRSPLIASNICGSSNGRNAQRIGISISNEVVGGLLTGNVISGNTEAGLDIQPGAAVSERDNQTS